MALDVLITTDRIARDPSAREFVTFLEGRASELNLDDASLYYDFPAYADYETVTHKPDALILSPLHGILAIRFIQEWHNDPQQAAQLQSIDQSLGQFCSILIGRLLKSRSLRRGLAALRFPVTPVVFMPGAGTSAFDLESSRQVASYEAFRALLAELSGPQQSKEVLEETRSVLEGAKALTRPQKRAIEDPKVQKLAAALAELEAEIANFDQRQRRAALISVPGPQRIRGLAGSGKTVILAMKAAHLHLTKPDDLILVTFNTRSLRHSIRALITKFFRHYRDEDPDWNKIHVRHGWGGSRLEGVYADACRREGVIPLTYGTARQQAGSSRDPFDYACRKLMQQITIVPYYDQVLIDEGQDFLSGFYELCFALTKGERDDKSIVWAYDELQNILDVKLRSPEQLFGDDSDGRPRVSLERSAANLPPGASNDTVLAKCYRNQREVLVTAHAVGFGIYGQIVQLLESTEHWEDVGYKVETEGPLTVGARVQIIRPAENSPVSLGDLADVDTIEAFTADTIDDEIRWATEQVKQFISGGLQPEDILVIALDDRNARAYWRALSTTLAAESVATNNITADPYDEPPFVIPGKVTLSTVYRAKGNEASVVLALGVDGVGTKSRAERNKLFTAFTRSKAWLRVSGVGKNAKTIETEVRKAMANFPRLKFKMPDMQKIEIIQRGLSEKAVRAKKIRDEYLNKLKDAGYSIDEIDEILSVGGIKDG